VVPPTVEKNHYVIGLFPIETRSNRRDHFFMSAFRLNLTATNPKREEMKSPTVDCLVDTGSELTWLPKEILEGIGVTPRKSRSFRMADGKLLTRPVGYAILNCGEFETSDEVVYAEPGDMKLLGVRTLEGFGAMADPIGHRLVAVSTLAASAAPIA
jgi:predicted aspartyl protease